MANLKSDGSETGHIKNIFLALHDQLKDQMHQLLLKCDK